MDALRVESENLAMVVMCFKVDDQKNLMASILGPRILKPFADTSFQCSDLGKSIWEGNFEKQGFP